MPAPGRSRVRRRLAGFAPSGLGVWPALTAKLREWIAAEAGAGRLLPWVPVAFGVGIALYFTADHEPVRWVTASAAALLAVRRFRCGGTRYFPIVVMIAAIAAGFAVATWRTR